MQKINKHIQIIRTSQYGLSSLSKSSAEAIQRVLANYYERVEIAEINTLEDLDSIVNKQPDLVFTGLKYVLNDAGRKIWIAGYLDQYGIEHTGSPQQAIRFEENKPLAKRRVQQAGLKTAAFKVFRNKANSPEHNLAFPLFVKPTSLGGGQGIDMASVVHNQAQLEAKVLTLDCDVLVEEYLTGREFSVAILEDEYTDQLNAMSIELVAPLNQNGDRILGQATKSSDAEAVSVIEDRFTRLVVNTFAINVFKALGARDYGRIDIRMDAKGVPHFLEANLIPSIIKGYGSFPKACELNTGLAYKDMILHIVRLGLSRGSSEEQIFTEVVNPLPAVQPV